MISFKRPPGIRAEKTEIEAAGRKLKLLITYILAALLI